MRALVLAAALAAALPFGGLAQPPAPRASLHLVLVINGHFEGSPASPAEAGDAIRKRFGDAPKKGGAMDPHDNAMEWTMNILAESVLPDMKPRVVISWLTEPDHIQHVRGAGSPEAVGSIRKDDAQIGKVLAKLAALGLQDKTDILVVSDHGFAQTEHNFVSSGAAGAVTTDSANHGGIGAWTVRNTMLAWGPDFKRGAVIRTPSANVDLAPTILYLLGLRQQAAGMQGRPLLEALVD